MSAGLVYRSSSPAAIDWAKRTKERFEEQRAKRIAFMKEQTEIYGVGLGSGSIRAGKRLLWITGERVTGIDSGFNEEPPSESGWRLDSKQRVWKPALRTAAGRLLNDRLESLSNVSTLTALAQIGVPQYVFGGLNLFRPGFEFDEEEPAVYVTWSGYDAAKEFTSSTAKVPEVEWEEVPLSRWYARLEAKEAAS